ncbi:MAG: hypothetical protein RMK64_07035 [Rhodovarius sp.]|nr:hypothetical protein [Rhodovarius sp.]MCX7932212.1 hypothetical protein [Rhodovarius sp.]MDW8314708.1 hypothetical protein [Rhodovarius sp.]
MLHLLAVDTAHSGRSLALALVTDSAGEPDLAAWRARDAGWPARISEACGSIREGELLHDPVAGWHLQLAGPGEAAEDSPRQNILFPAGPLRPGALLRTIGPEGEETSWRILELR